MAKINPSLLEMTPAHQRRLIYAAFAIVLIAASYLRFHNLGSHPPGLFCDEAASGYNAFAIAEAGISEEQEPWPILFWSFAAYKYPTYIYPAALGVKLFGLDEFTTRLPAAIYGTLSVATIFLIGWLCAGPWVGLFAAIFLTFMPWHVQFSRIAFSLISFGFLSSLTILLLLLYTRGWRTLPAAAATAALCLYSYAVSAVFIPLFLTGFALLYFPELLRRWKQSLLAIVVGLACAYPIVDFYQSTPRAWKYGSRISWVDLSIPKEGTLAERATTLATKIREQAPRFAKHYSWHFSDDFLFLKGDPIVRHSVRNHGELLPLWIDIDRPITLPFFGTVTNREDQLPFAKVLLLLGVAVCLLRPDRRSKLILVWLAAFPVGASMIRELPSASRSFVGTGVFALLAAIALGSVLKAIHSVVRHQSAAWVTQIATVTAFAALLFIPGARKYLHEYFVEYPKYAAPGPGGFQFGYGPAIQYMESVRDQYDLLMISTSSTNQPPIFPRFYNQIDPHKGRSREDLGYFVADPAHYIAYDIDQRILFALRRQDLSYFTDYEIKKRIVAPGGQETFLVTEVRARKQYLNKWLTLGPFDNSDLKGIEKDFIPVEALSTDRIVNSDGEKVTWREIRQIFVRTNLNDFYAWTSDKKRRKPERICAYAMTTLTTNRTRDTFLEIDGSDIVRIWLNNEEITDKPLPLKPEPQRLEIKVRKGDNPLVIFSCEDIGSWLFQARIVDKDGNDVEDIETSARLPQHSVETEE